jgi:hypothetical protein
VKVVLELEFVKLLRVELDPSAVERLPPTSLFDLGETDEFRVAESFVLAETLASDCRVE